MATNSTPARAKANWLTILLAAGLFITAVGTGWFGQHAGLSWAQYYLAPVLALLSALLFISPGDSPRDPR